jgi:hypothetical protein
MLGGVTGAPHMKLKDITQWGQSAGRSAAWPPGKRNVDCSHMMIDDDTLKQLLRINDELLQLCKWMNEKRDIETSSRLIPLVDDLTYILIEAGKNKLH